MRFVSERVKSAGVGQLRSGSASSSASDYGERIAKYVPVEIVAAYIVVNGMAAVTPAPGLWFTLAFIICAALTPIYVIRTMKTRVERIVNCVMAMAAFVVWAYATGGGWFAYLHLYNAPTAAVVVALFTAVSGAVVPVARMRPPAPTLPHQAPPSA